LFAALSQCRRMLLILLLVAGATQVCLAHAVLMESTPKINSTVQGPDLDITLRFNVRIDGSRSRILLMAKDGTSTALALAKQSKPNILQTHASGLKPGAYKLQWNVLASDGHMSKGDVPFTVK
jgi:methionine-rich copper-binding protein CopC